MRVRSLPLPSELRIWCCHELWRRPAAVAPISPLAWKLPYDAGTALKKKKKDTQKNSEQELIHKGLEWMRWLGGAIPPFCAQAIGLN